MKLFLLSMALCTAAILRADAPDPIAGFSPDDLDQLVGPIALYPDPLLAVMLPASTESSDIVLASRFFSSGGDLSQVDDQPWDSAVRALAHYPTIIQWMDDNLQYTKTLGEAFLSQPKDVMQAIQRLRAKALAGGTLSSNPHQTVVMEGSDICIEPAMPNTVFIPTYDPEQVFGVPPGFGGDYVSFSVGWPGGPWLAYECDWDDFGVWLGSWHGRWGYFRDWRSASGDRPGRFWSADLRRAHRLPSHPVRPSTAPVPHTVRPFVPRPGQPRPQPSDIVRYGREAPQGTVRPSNSPENVRRTFVPAPRSPAPAAGEAGPYYRSPSPRENGNRPSGNSAQPSYRSAPPPSRAEAPARSEPARPAPSASEPSRSDRKN